MIKFLGEGEAMPKGYGLCYQHMHMYGFAIAPIPFNFVIALWKRIEWFLMRNPFAAKPKGCIKCFEAGFYRGRKMQDHDFLESYRRFLVEQQDIVGDVPDDK